MQGPVKIVKGITAWVQHDEALGIETLCLYVRGIRSRPNRGNATGFMAYAAEDTIRWWWLRWGSGSAHYPTESWTSMLPRRSILTAEVQRLARALCPSMVTLITATRFRHQWAADVRASGDGDAASRSWPSKHQNGVTTARRIRPAVGILCVQHPSKQICRSRLVGVAPADIASPLME